jgi:hypothetical protein
VQGNHHDMAPGWTAVVSQRLGGFKYEVQQR